MNAAAPAAPATGELRIGEVARTVGVTTRTIRYYEELGLLRPSGHSPGGARRYTEPDVARLLRIKELQDLMGLDLDAIRTILHAEDRLQDLRAEYRTGDPSAERRAQIVREALDINTQLRARVQARLAQTQAFLEGLEAKAERYRTLLAETDAVAATDEDRATRGT
ncbi:MAG: MerR family transcriptional regulator [Planctomycetaceae bacterium]